MLDKLADFYDESELPRYPSIDELADPALRNGTWGPWRKTASELGLNKSGRSLELEKYNQELYHLTHHIGLVSNVLIIIYEL